MSPSTPSSLDVVRQFYAALNWNDLAEAVCHFAPDIERVEPEGFATGGTYRGLATVKAHLAHGRGTWAEGACEPEELFAKGDKVVAYVRVRVRLKNAAEWVEGRFADGFEFRAGQIALFRSFAQRAEAMAWAGL